MVLVLLILITQRHHYHEIIPMHRSTVALNIVIHRQRVPFPQRNFRHLIRLFSRGIMCQQVTHRQFLREQAIFQIFRVVIFPLHFPRII